MTAMYTRSLTEQNSDQEIEVSIEAWSHQVTAHGNGEASGTLGVQVKAPGGEYEVLRDVNGDPILINLVDARGIQFEGVFEKIKLTPVELGGSTYDAQLCGSGGR